MEIDVRFTLYKAGNMFGCDSSADCGAVVAEHASSLGRVRVFTVASRPVSLRAIPMVAIQGRHLARELGTGALVIVNIPPAERTLWRQARRLDDEVVLNWAHRARIGPSVEEFIANFLSNKIGRDQSRKSGLHTYAWLMYESVLHAIATGASVLDASCGNCAYKARLGMLSVALTSTVYLTQPDDHLISRLGAILPAVAGVGRLTLTAQTPDPADGSWWHGRDSPTGAKAYFQERGAKATVCDTDTDTDGYKAIVQAMTDHENCRTTPPRHCALSPRRELSSLWGAVAP